MSQKEEKRLQIEKSFLVQNRDILLSILKSLSPEEKKEIISSLKEQVKEEFTVPISVFRNNKLSCLETIVKYLKENYDLKLIKISKLLNRNSKTIWATYNKAAKKLAKRFIAKEENISIPLSIFKSRKYSVLESVVGYLKEEHELSYHQISELLNRSYRTIATVYRRYRLKK
ncbi:hypothetical protein CMO89_03795 [Candidatus Woesearchaeota archaeon]|nr:hypothetical protein [Candidatus Woesearchaeota archaeon]